MRGTATKTHLNYNSVKCAKCGRANQTMMERASVVICKHCGAKIFVSSTFRKKAG